MMVNIILRYLLNILVIELKSCRIIVPHLHKETKRHSDSKILNLIENDETLHALQRDLTY